jgi:hypothetical protein
MSGKFRKNATRDPFMSTSLVSSISEFLTPEMVAKIASALGVDGSFVSKAIGAAVPSLLGGLAGMAGTSDGAQKLFQAVSQQPSSMLESLASTIGGSGQAALVENGTKALASLLGPAAVSGLGGALAKYSGMGGATTSSMLGLLTPVVMGMLGKQVGVGSLTANSLASLLTSQKSTISAALPAGFADMLSSAGVFNSLAGGATAASQTARSAAQTVSANASRGVQQATKSSGLVRWLLPLLAVAAIAWWFLGNRGPNIAEQAKTSASQAVQSLQNLVVGGVDVGSSIQKTVDGLRSALLGVRDVDTARAALPGLQDASAQLDRLSGLVGQLPASGKSALASFLVSVRPSLDEAFNKVLALPGVSEVAKPSIDAIRAKLDTLSRA